jgi:hypothetical protein
LSLIVVTRNRRTENEKSFQARRLRSWKLKNEAEPRPRAELFISTNDFAILIYPPVALFSFFFFLRLMLSFSAPFIHHLDLVLSNKQTRTAVAEARAREE